MRKTPLEKAYKLLQRRKFAMAISLLESGNNPEIYRENFFYFLTAGLACLYVGDTGTADSYFQRARRIRMTDTTLLKAQAVLFLRRGDVEKAIQYYLTVLDYSPDDKLALNAMDFLKAHGTYEEICRLVDTNEIERFYPSLGVNPDNVVKIGLSVLAGIFLAIVIFNFANIGEFSRRMLSSSKGRADLSHLFLTVDEKKNPQSKDLSNGVYRYLLNDKQILRAYEDAVVFYGDGRENAAQVEVNRILNSNASDAIKENARTVSSYFQEQTFDSLLDNYDYSVIAKDPVLYIGCWVAWSGRVSNSVTEGKSYRCDLLVGYENMDRVEGFVPLYFEEAPYPAIDGERPVRVLARIENKDDKLVLKGRAVYQPLKR